MKKIVCVAVLLVGIAGVTVAENNNSALKDLLALSNQQKLTAVALPLAVESAGVKPATDNRSGKCDRIQVFESSRIYSDWDAAMRACNKATEKLLRAKAVILEDRVLGGGQAYYYKITFIMP